MVQSIISHASNKTKKVGEKEEKIRTSQSIHNTHFFPLVYKEKNRHLLILFYDLFLLLLLLLFATKKQSKNTNKTHLDRHFSNRFSFNFYDYRVSRHLDKIIIV